MTEADKRRKEKVMGVLVITIALVEAMLIGFLLTL